MKETGIYMISPTFFFPLLLLFSLFSYYTLHSIYTVNRYLACFSQHVVILEYTWLYSFYHNFYSIIITSTHLIIAWVDGKFGNYLYNADLLTEDRATRIRLTGEYDGHSDSDDHYIHSITSFSDSFVSIYTLRYQGHQDNLP